MWTRATVRVAARTRRRLQPLASVLRRLVSDVTNVDGTLLPTLRALVRQPGELTRRYALGQFAGQVAPSRVYLASAVYFLVAPLLGDGSIRESLGGGSQVSWSFGPFAWNSQILLALLVPLWAIAVQAVAFDKAEYFEESFVFSVHYHVIFLVTLLLLIAIVATCQLLSAPAVARWCVTLGAFVPLPYLFLALRRAFELGAARAGATAAVLFVGHLLLGGLLFDLF